MMEKLMMNAVKQKMPVSASFFRSSIDAFQRRFVDIKITGALSGFAIQTRTHRICVLTEGICRRVKRGG